MQNDLKIIIVGPPKSGKTEIADILSAASKGFQGKPYQPTVGIRILEFATQVEVNGLQTNISVQLWDTSGDEKWSVTWPAIAKDADGAIIIYNAHEENAGRAVANYAKAFTMDLEAQQVLVIAHKIGETDAKPSRPKLLRHLEQSKIVLTNAKEGLDDFNEDFATFLGNVYAAKVKKIEEEEKRLIGQAPAPKPPSRAKAAPKPEASKPEE